MTTGKEEKEYAQFTKDLVTEYSLKHKSLGDIAKLMFSRVRDGKVSEDDFIEALFEWFAPEVYDGAFDDGYECCMEKHDDDDDCEPCLCPDCVKKIEEDKKNSSN